MTTTDSRTVTLAPVGAAATIRIRALNRIAAYTARAEKAAADPEPSTEAAHRERAAYWACTAREAGATEGQIDAADAAGTAQGIA